MERLNCLICKIESSGFSQGSARDTDTFPKLILSRSNFISPGARHCSDDPWLELYMGRVSNTFFVCENTKLVSLKSTFD